MFHSLSFSLPSLSLKKDAFEQGPESNDGANHVDSGGRSFQSKGIALERLSWKSVQGPARGPVWLMLCKPGKSVGQWGQRIDWWQGYAGSYDEGSGK